MEIRRGILVENPVTDKSVNTHGLEAGPRFHWAGPTSAVMTSLRSVKCQTNCTKFPGFVASSCVDKPLCVLSSQKTSDVKYISRFLSWPHYLDPSPSVVCPLMRYVPLGSVGLDLVCMIIMTTLCRCSDVSC